MIPFRQPPRPSSFSTSTSTSTLMQPINNVERVVLQEFEQITNELEADYQLLLFVNRKINNAMKVSSRALSKIHSRNISLDEENFSEILSSVEELREIVGSHHNARGQFEKLSLGIESLTEVQLFLHFLTHGKLLPLSSVHPCDDEEFVGATLNFGQQLVRYCSNSALEGDIDTVLFCKSFVSSLQGKYLEFFFRNGPLRKKFDGLKYTVKRLDGIVFDVSMISSSPSPFLQQEPPVESSSTGSTLSLPYDLILDSSSPLLGKRRICADSEDNLNPNTVSEHLKETHLQHSLTRFENHPFFCHDDINAIKDRLSEYDRQREVVIKKTRDIQKYSKQAIFSFHGKRFREGREKLQSAKKIADEIKIILIENPSLRLSSFSNSIEEWVEARLFEEYLLTQQIMTRQALQEEFQQAIHIHEYIGGLSDLTGEIGRLAVLYGTTRDLSSLTPSYQICETISRALNEVTLTTGKFYQKSNTSKLNVSKMEGLIYELTMSLKSENGRVYRPLEVLAERGVAGGRQDGDGAGSDMKEDEI